MKPDKAFILAAGFGTRLRPYTNDIPKPMVTVNNETLIDHTLAHLQKSGIKDFVINTHYKAEILHDHYKTHSDIHISHEPEILDTGGGIKNALSHFNGKDFFVLSGDGYWSNGSGAPTITQMKNSWDSKKMDILILLQPIDTMKVTKGIGDYDIDDQGRAIRSLDKTGQHMFTSIRINQSSIFETAPDQEFSYLQLLDEAEKKGRLFALIHNGEWHHISTPEDLDAVRQAEKK